MKEYDIFIPLYYSDNSLVEAKKFQSLQTKLLNHFEGVTFIPRPLEGFWQVGQVTFRDEVVVYRVLAKNARNARRLLKTLKEDCKKVFRQPEILVMEREADTF